MTELDLVTRLNEAADEAPDHLVSLLWEAAKEIERAVADANEGWKRKDEATLHGQKQYEEIERLKKKCDQQAMVLRRIYVEQYPDTWFVHTAHGEVDENGLPQYIDVVPAYGCDWSQVYERTKKTIGGMGS
jgi:hypothetical protein